ncbi:MAG: lysophospholipid acyltransferase family protein [Planctomycetota bacterium]|jgi:KDO2-lipid IV(A) lauroyltransferase
MPKKSKKKKKKGNIVLDFLFYALIRLLVLFLSLFTINANLRTARYLGRLLWKYYHRGRERALTNLHASYPEKSEEWIHQTGKKSFEHLAMFGMDVLIMPRIVEKHNWREYSRFKNAEYAKWLMKEGKGVLLVTPHYANFEIIGYMLGLFGFDIYSVARPLDNKFINNWLYSVRQRHSQKIIDKKGATEMMSKITAEGATLCFIADQDAGKKGVFVDFFGRKASTYKSIALLAVMNEIPIIAGGSRRVDDRFFFEINAVKIIFPEEWKDKDNPVTWITQEYTRAFEDLIREDPTQYWWLHRRWKHRPKEELQQNQQQPSA